MSKAQNPFSPTWIVQSVPCTFKMAEHELPNPREDDFSVYCNKHHVMEKIVALHRKTLKGCV